jgi:hypothetical protein
MSERTSRSTGGWRQWIAGLLVFALVVQGLMLALAGAQASAGATGEPDWAGFEVCRHGGTSPSDPASDTADGHCVPCLAGATLVLHAPPPSAECHRVAHTVAPWRLARWRLPALTVDATALPRGPPSSA